MRVGASAPVVLFLLLWGGGAEAAARLRLDLPPGPLSAAVAALSAESGASIGASDPRLLTTPLPGLHLEGSTAELLASLARRAGVAVVQTGPEGWRITRSVPSAPAPARNGSTPTPVAEIVVQAPKRPERLQDYPAEIVRIAGDDLGRYGDAPDTGALTARIPILAATDWGGGQEKLFLRGVADSSFTGTSPALVGEYLGDQSLTYDAPDPDLRLYDVASVEVLAGPQGALYGAGALGGLIRIEPNAPVLDRLTGSAWAGLTNTAHGASGGDAGGVLNLPLVADRLALRAVGYAAEDPGYIDDVGRGLRDVNRVDTRGGRAVLRWALDEAWRIDLGAVTQRIDNRDAPYADVGRPPLTRSSAFAQPSHNLFVAGSLTVVGRLGGVDLHSTTGVVRQSLGQRFEALRPGSQFARFDEDARPQQLSQEMRLSGRSRVMSWVVGASYVESSDTETRDFGRLDNPSLIARLHDRTVEVTGYGEATQRLMGGLSATLGVRYASVRQYGDALRSNSPFLFTPVVRARIVGSERHLLPSAGLSYQVAPGATVFVRHGQGFRPGGLTLGGVAERFSGDRLSTLEAGLRRDAVGTDRVALTLTAALSRWRRIQADLLDGNGMPEVANIGDGRIASVDASVAVRITAGLSLNASGFLARSRLDPSPALAEEGRADALPDVAHNGGAAALDYRGRLADGRLWQAGIRVQHVGPSLLGVGPLLARAQGDYTTVALGGGVRLGGADLVLNVSNLLDCRNHTFAVGTPLAALIESDVTPLRPRTVRLGLRYGY